MPSTHTAGSLNMQANVIWNHVRNGCMMQRKSQPPHLSPEPAVNKNKKEKKGNNSASSRKPTPEEVEIDQANHSIHSHS
ncbi:hypothetical protein M413DRAFT_239354 [Hebeloma cylindrosporum]|uniref:Uncharacterized protein n=1 Tax=Hebeloma cylindrosporum TaxID=76867 RepID=A0A0C3C5P9_HEBCY|nr:hypothetical protein M413DRAFT_239354 [Hebeloma cylindrosporum h7]